ASLPAINSANPTGPALAPMPGNRPADTATCRASAAASSALDGTHPVFTHVPPTVPRSIITTDASRRRAATAPAHPAPPEPMIARSYPIAQLLDRQTHPACRMLPRRHSIRLPDTIRLCG